MVEFQHRGNFYSRGKDLHHAQRTSQFTAAYVDFLKFVTEKFTRMNGRYFPWLACRNPRRGTTLQLQDRLLD